MACVTSFENEKLSDEYFKAERKLQRNRWADFVNRVKALCDHVAPGNFGGLYETVRPYSMMSRARLRGIYDGIRGLAQRDIPGDFVECGTAKGGCAALMGLASKQQQLSRSLWVFDTFEGLPPPTKDDPDFDLAKAWEGECRGGYDEVQDLFDRLGVLEEITMVKGLFQDTVPTAEVRQIALLHLDGDWYDSTMVCLAHLYDKVSPGGIVQIDDYGHWAGARKALHEFMDARNLDVDLRYLDYSGRQFVKPG